MTLAALALAVVSPLTPFPPGEVTVGGEIGRRMAAAADCLTQRIDIENAYFRHFRVRREKPEVWGGFTGWSMALDALVKAAAHGIGGDEMRRFKDKWLRETCATAYLLRLCAGRMAAGDETRYGDLYERVLYNAFFAAQSADGRRHRYFTPFDQPGEWWERGDTYCCPNNFRRMVFEIPDAVFARRKDGIAVNLYAPARLKTAGLDVEMKTFPGRQARGILVGVLV